MIRFNRTIFDSHAPFCVAVSGGKDSMAVLSFLRSNPRRDITALHYNHGTPFADRAQELVEQYCREYRIPLCIGRRSAAMPVGVSREAFWRESRYSFFEDVCGSRPVITCHHLDDVVETWIFTSLHGQGRLIPALRDVYVRPFLETRSQDLADWCERKSVPFIEDPSNTDTAYMRNYIRHILMPHALRVNPGLPKTLRKKVQEMYASFGH